MPMVCGMIGASVGIKICYSFILRRPFLIQKKEGSCFNLRLKPRETLFVGERK